MSTWIIFRKSANTNSFGLRGYWEYNPETRALREFATSRELEIGDVVTEPTMGFTREIPENKGTVPLHQRALFEAALPFRIVKGGILVRVGCDPSKTFSVSFPAGIEFGDVVKVLQGAKLAFSGSDAALYEAYSLTQVTGATYTTEQRA